MLVLIIIILDVPSLSCVCFRVKGFGDKEVVTTSRPRPMPQWLREQLYSDDGASKRTRAKVNEECPKCGHPEMEFWTVQLRSVDEGQTVFYEVSAFPLSTGRSAISYVLNRLSVLKFEMPAHKLCQQLRTERVDFQNVYI
jgi:hypothetical protein